MDERQQKEAGQPDQGGPLPRHDQHRVGQGPLRRRNRRRRCRRRPSERHRLDPAAQLPWGGGPSIEKEDERCREKVSTSRLINPCIPSYREVSGPQLIILIKCLIDIFSLKVLC